MRRLLALSALAVVAFAPAAFADHAEEADGCDHGATSVPCRPDPSPNGQDCLVHGNHGGQNEDHCDDEVTPSTTTSTEPATTTSTQPGTPTTSTTTVVPSTTSTSTVAQPGTPTTTRLVPADPAPVTATPTSVTELPRTGWGSTVVVFFGLWCLLGGVTALALAQLIRGTK